MISCEQSQNLFEAYLNGELSAPLTAELDAHRLECAACRHQLALLEACGNVVRLDTREPATSADFSDRILAILEEDASKQRSLQVSRGMKITGGLLGIAASLAIFVGLSDPDQHGDVVPSDIPPHVAGASTMPQPMTSVAESMASDYFPLGAIWNMTESAWSILELGELSIGHLQDTTNNTMSLPAESLNTYPTSTTPMQIIESFPELDDGSEVL